MLPQLKNQNCYFLNLSRFSRIAINCVCIHVVALYGIVSNVEANDDRIVAITDCRFIEVKKTLNSYYHTYLICILVLIVPGYWDYLKQLT